MEVALNEVPLFVRKRLRDSCLPTRRKTVDAIDYDTIRMVGYEGADYTFREDVHVTIL